MVIAAKEVTPTSIFLMADLGNRVTAGWSTDTDVDA
jgi:hypothetical protein